MLLLWLWGTTNVVVYLSSVEWGGVGGSVAFIYIYSSWLHPWEFRLRNVNVVHWFAHEMRLSDWLASFRCKLEIIPRDFKEKTLPVFVWILTASLYNNRVKTNKWPKERFESIVPLFSYIWVRKVVGTIAVIVMFFMLVARFFKESNEKKINSTLIIRMI